MTNRRPPITGRDVAGAGVLMLSVNAVCAAMGAGLGALVGAVVPLFVAGLLCGFVLGVLVVINRFHDV